MHLLLEYSRPLTNTTRRRLDAALPFSRGPRSLAERNAYAERLEQASDNAALSGKALKPDEFAFSMLLYDLNLPAEQERDYLTGRDRVPFELPDFIEPVMSEIFQHLNAFDDLRGSSADDFAWEAGVVANAINTCHPFINGNGRTLRAFLQDLAQQAGYRIDYDYFGPDEWHAASRDAFQTQSGAPFHDLLRNAILPSKPHPETSAMADDTDASLLDRAGPVVAKTASAIGDAAEKASDLMGGFIDILSEGVWSLLGAPTQPSYLAGQPLAETPPADMPPPLVPEDPLLVYRKQKDEFESYAARHWHDEAGIARREAALDRAKEAAMAAHPHVFAAEEQANQKEAQGETASQQFRPR